MIGRCFDYTEWLLKELAAAPSPSIDLSGVTKEMLYNIQTKILAYENRATRSGDLDSSDKFKQLSESVEKIIQSAGVSKPVWVNRIKNVPQRIYLQVSDELGDMVEDFKELSEVSWCHDKIYANDIPYVLDESVAPEPVEGKNERYCPNCNKLHTATDCYGYCCENCMKEDYNP